MTNYEYTDIFEITFIFEISTIYNDIKYYLLRFEGRHFEKTPTKNKLKPQHVKTTDDIRPQKQFFGHKLVATYPRYQLQIFANSRNRSND